MAAQNNKIHFKCIALNFQAEPQYTVTLNAWVVILQCSNFIEKHMVRGDCCAAVKVQSYAGRSSDRVIVITVYLITPSALCTVLSACRCISL